MDAGHRRRITASGLLLYLVLWCFDREKKSHNTCGHLRRAKSTGGRFKFSAGLQAGGTAQRRVGVPPVSRYGDCHTSPYLAILLDPPLEVHDLPS
jgi:hypothetical protein